MKQVMKKKNNKGFSLVEMIVVIAIMAILVGVLAPTIMHLIEKSRTSKDIQLLDGFYTGGRCVLATEKSFMELRSANKLDTDITLQEIQQSLPITNAVICESLDINDSGVFQMVSAKFKGLTSDKITYHFNSDGVNVSVVIESVDNSGYTLEINKDN